MGRIPRTPRSFAPIRSDWIDTDQLVPDMPREVIESDYPTHSCVLGADGMPLEYEPRPTIGFDLTPRATPADGGGR